jgi:hypothetical protein
MAKLLIGVVVCLMMFAELCFGRSSNATMCTKGQERVALDTKYLAIRGNQPLKVKWYVPASCEVRVAICCCDCALASNNSAQFHATMRGKCELVSKIRSIIATIGITDDGRMSLLGWIGTVNSMYTSITP